MVTATQPTYRKRFFVVIVVRVNTISTTNFAGLANKAPALDRLPYSVLGADNNFRRARSRSGIHLCLGKVTPHGC